MKKINKQVRIEDENDQSVLLKYGRSRPVEESDISILRKYADMGLVHFGFNLGKRKPQAKSTKDKKLLNLTG